ncbi:hypothetical protein GXW74_06660 [Roseomonas eburnea]|uniref:Uncharacterized protein n=1 Tax=Neoroseomonas eburnea TaxID=1346889 RepID=A0A9X9X8X5_9PROT|nr:hypothetical protein [Neoroseomonas eburnea]MBR0680161.1 hypothetical protein [Neoroseomonas eburnea]
MAATHDILLLHGLAAEATPRRRARLRSMTGAEEEGCVAAAEQGLPVRVALSRLIAGCVERLGDAPIAEEDAEALSIGDRETLALAIRAASFAGPMRARLACTACGEALDLALGPRELLAPATPAAPRLELGGVRLAFRPVTARDQAAVADLAGEEAAGAAMLSRCVTIEDDGDITALPRPAQEATAAHLLALDPMAETLLSCVCPACGAVVEGSLDAGAFLVEEIARRGPALAREVLLIARATGWGEQAILAMPRQRRLRYAALLGGEAP